jgi:O-antigen ligase
MNRIVGAFIAGGLVAACYDLAAPSQFEAEYGRLESAALDPNELSAVLVPAVAICMFIAVNRASDTTVRLSAAVVGMLCGATIVLTVSRGGLIALAVAVLLAVVCAGPLRARIAAIAAVGVVGILIYFAGFAGPSAIEHLESTTQGSQRVQEGRTTIWQVAWRMAQDNPALGVGAGNFQATSIHYVLEPGATRRSDLIIDNPLVVHNTYLETLVELGVVGATLFLGLIGLCVSAVIKAIGAFKRLGNGHMEGMARGLLVAMGGILVADFFISEQFSKALWLLLALGPAMLVVARRQARTTLADA